MALHALFLFSSASSATQRSAKKSDEKEAKVVHQHRQLDGPAAADHPDEKEQ